MLTIGSKVKYIRAKGAEIVEGEGYLKGLGLDPENRDVALIREIEGEGKSFNCPAKCVNPTDEFKAEYTKMVKSVMELAEEGNKRSKAIVEEYNGQIVELHNSLLGKPHVFESSEPMISDGGEAGEVGEAA